jgi:hypothetical protein
MEQAWYTVDESDAAWVRDWHKWAHRGLTRLLDAWPYVGFLTTPVVLVIPAWRVSFGICQHKDD